MSAATDTSASDPAAPIAPSAVRLRGLRLRVPSLDAFIRSASTQRAISAMRRAPFVETPWRMLTLELIGPERRAQTYTLKRSTVKVAVHHRSPDVWVFDEVFVGQPTYEPPTDASEHLCDGMRVLDLGGNVGMFGAFVLQRWPRARITSFEPDPVNLGALRRCRDLNGAAWEIIPACAAICDGSTEFAGGHGGFSRASAVLHEPGSVTVSTIDVFSHIDAADFVKMDIEGSEWPILLDSRFESVGCKVLVIEWHRMGCPHDEPFALVCQRLTSAGFTFSGRDHGEGHGLIWAWR